MKLAPFLKEITLQKSGFFPFVKEITYDNGTIGTEFDYGNIVKNIKIHKNAISKHLGSPPREVLDKFLVHYVHELHEMDHIGEQDLYKDITLEEFLEDLQNIYESSTPEDWESNYDSYYPKITIQDLQEITIRPNFTIDPNPVYGMSNTATDIFGVDHLMQLVDLGNYYTIMPYGNQPFVILIPKQYVKNITPLPTHKSLSSEEMDQIKNLVNQGKTEIVKPIQTESTKSFKDLLIESYQQKVKSIINEYVQQALKEYSEATIKNLFKKWGIDPEEDPTKAGVARAVITRFDQIKDRLPEKKDTLAIPDELKNKDIKNIEIYSFEDLEKLVKSYPENPEKKKKEAVEKFVKKEQIDKPVAQSYVARFMANQAKLKSALSNGTEDGLYTKEEVARLIPRSLLQNEAYLDPRNWNFHSLEQVLDTLFPSQSKNSEDINNVSTDADKIYDKDGIEIYKGDDKHKCISYNPVLSSTNRQKYSWCVTQASKAGNMYDYYRLKDESPTFYFIFDRNKSSAPDHSPFNDIWHAFVIRISIDGKKYYITHANNPPDAVANGWEDIARIVPADTWAKIKGLKDYFKPIELSTSERSRKFAQGKNLSLSEFKALSPDEKLTYVIGKAQENKLSNDILQILPKIKTIEEGRSTTLANVAINNGQQFPYYVLKDSEALSKRYAIFRFRQNEAIPLPFVKYLDKDAQQKYLETFDGNLTFEYIDKYFGPEVAEKYVDSELKKLGFLPQAAIKYIKNPKLKQLFELYSKLFSGWGYSDSTNMDEEKLESLSTMPQQTAYITPFTQQQWINLSPQERVSIIKLVEQFNKNSTYDALLYGAPFIVKDGAKTYVLVANKSEYPDKFALMDEQGRIVKDNIPSTSELGPINLTSPYPEEDFNKIYDIKDLKVA